MNEHSLAGGQTSPNPMREIEPSFPKDGEKREDFHGLFFGFKLHLVIHNQGEPLSFHQSKATTYDRIPIPTSTKGLWGIEELFQRDPQLITKLLQDLFFLCSYFLASLVERTHDLGPLSWEEAFVYAS